MNCHFQRRLKKPRTDKFISSCHRTGFESLFLGDAVLVVCRWLSTNLFAFHMSTMKFSFSSSQASCLLNSFYTKQTPLEKRIRSGKAFGCGKQRHSPAEIAYFLSFIVSTERASSGAFKHIHSGVLYVILATKRIRTNSRHSSSPHHSVVISTQIKLCLAPNNSEL